MAVDQDRVNVTLGGEESLAAIARFTGSIAAIKEAVERLGIVFEETYPRLVALGELLKEVELGEETPGEGGGDAGT